MSDKKIVILGRDNDSTIMLYNYLSMKYENIILIMENPQSYTEFFKRRIKKLGWRKVTGQVVFILYTKVLCRLSQKRIREIITKSGFTKDINSNIDIKKVFSINSKECKKILKQISPAIVILNGTRIVSTEILNSIDAPFVNIHAGITPKYRGVHGAYWALANRDIKNCGVTVHLVDEGIDTGGILYQKTITPTEKDNFCTYPYLQFCAGVKLLEKAIEDIFLNRAKPYSKDLASKLWYHPTIVEYIKNFIRLGIR